MTTICSYCGRNINETDDKYLTCKYCLRTVPKGSNSYNKLKGGNNENMAEKKVNKTIFVKCVKCGKDKFVRKDVYEARVAKFGSVEKLNAEYICRDCKRELREAAAPVVEESALVTEEEVTQK